MTLSESTVSRIFSESVIEVAQTLNEIIIWPPASKIKKLLPRARYSKVESIIDCLEIEIQEPQNAVHQALTRSEYKKANTLKYLISSSDAEIVKESGFLGKLELLYTPTNRH